MSHVKPVSLGVLCVSSGTADSSIHGMSLLNSFLIVGRGDFIGVGTRGQRGPWPPQSWALCV